VRDQPIEPTVVDLILAGESLSMGRDVQQVTSCVLNDALSDGSVACVVYDCEALPVSDNKVMYERCVCLVELYADMTPKRVMFSGVLATRFAEVAS
jgi:hypothetical protein